MNYDSDCHPKSNYGLSKYLGEKLALEFFKGNTVILRTSAEMIKIAMIRIAEEISKLNLRSKLVLQIHDELIFEFPSEEEEVLVKLVIDKMENAMKLNVPIVVDYGIGNSWYEAH